MSIDFAAIRAANPIADVVGRYVELRRAGSEFRGLCPFHADKSPSLYVNPRKGKAFCMACHWAGDAIDFVAEYEACDLAEAARKLGHDELPKDRPPPAPLPPDASDDWRPILPVPDDAPAYDPAQTFNPKRGRAVRYQPAKTWAYRDADGRLLGYVLRLEIDGKKITPTITYCQHKDGTRRWCTKPFPVQRPLYGLDRLAARPDAPVVVVEGEKAADAAQAALPRMVVVTWPGGTNGVRWADFGPLELRDVTFWPDADDVGVEAMLAVSDKVPIKRQRWIRTDGLPQGFDAADVEGDIAAFCKERVTNDRPFVVVDRPAAEGSEPERGAPIADEPGGREVDSDTPAPVIQGELVDDRKGTAYGAVVSWSSLGLETNDKGTPHANLDNAVRVLQGHPELQGRIWLDEFTGRIHTDWPTGQVVEWSDAHDNQLNLFVQRILKLHRMGITTIQQAVNTAAFNNRRNELVEWLNGLQWDGQDRLCTFMGRAFGAQQDAYTAAVGRCWLISMVARAFQPGCKVDTMPVFEGVQGKSKSTALGILGGKWYAENNTDVTSKDFIENIQGVWLVEIAEMHAFGKAEVERIKSIITCRNDRYRAAYARRSEDHLRRCVFAGTTNRNDWNRDETGARRFWPVACTVVDLDWLTANRDQLFAEAVVLYRAGTPWWDIPIDLAKEEQDKRRAADAWDDPVAEYVDGRFWVTTGQVLEQALRVPIERQDLMLQRRVGSILRAMGWQPTVRKSGGRPERGWVPPDQAL